MIEDSEKLRNLIKIREISLSLTEFDEIGKAPDYGTYPNDSLQEAYCSFVSCLADAIIEEINRIRREAKW